MISDHLKALGSKCVSFRMIFCGYEDVDGENRFEFLWGRDKNHRGSLKCFTNHSLLVKEKSTSTDAVCDSSVQHGIYFY